MATAADVIKAALRRIQVIEAETPIEATEIQDGLEDLNDMGSLIESSEIALGFIRMSQTSDVINIPDEALGMYKDRLALYVAGQYGAPIPQTLAQSAVDSMSAVLRTFQGPIDVAYPDSLPTGSGNECDNLAFRERFFDENKSENF